MQPRLSSLGPNWPVAGVHPGRARPDKPAAEGLDLEATWGWHHHSHLKRLLGAPAAEPLAYYELDWSREPFTSVLGDEQPPRSVPLQGSVLLRELDWADTLNWAGAEASTSEWDRLAGAVDSGRRAAAQILSAANLSRYLAGRRVPGGAAASPLTGKRGPELGGLRRVAVPVSKTIFRAPSVEASQITFFTTRSPVRRQPPLPCYIS